MTGVGRGADSGPEPVNYRVALLDYRAREKYTDMSYRRIPAGHNEYPAIPRLQGTSSRGSTAGPGRKVRDRDGEITFRFLRLAVSLRNACRVEAGVA
jgi:hypothetical protein